MEVVKDNCGLLSNLEVLMLLREVKDEVKNKKKKENKGLATIAYETVKYLDNSGIKDETNEQVTAFLLAIKNQLKMRLTKAEKLQILNLRPATLVELQLLVEESEERFSEQAMMELLECVKTSLTCKVEEEEEEDGDVDEEESDGEEQEISRVEKVEKQDENLDDND